GPAVFFHSSGILSQTGGQVIVVGLLFAVAGVVVWFYDSGSWGIKLFEVLLKVMVGVVVVSFVGVVVAMSMKGGLLDWGAIFSGFIPNPSQLFEPSAKFGSALASVGEYSSFWKSEIVGQQQQVMITAAATAVGINMTFLLPYSMMKRGWDRDFRGLAVFDLATGLFIPFLLATSCVVIASASQFHATPAPGLLGETDKNGLVIQPPKDLVGGFNKLLDKRLKEEKGAAWLAKIAEDTKSSDKEKADASKAELDRARSELPKADRELAAMLVKRDAFNLAGALEPLTGKGVAQYIFGIGVLGMAISTIIILMLINGFVICEMLGLKSEGMPHRLGCFLAAVVGAIGSFFWTGDAKLWLAVPTSMFGFMLLPIAYFTFFFMMNSKSLMGENLPQGGKRIVWNVLMGVAAGMAALGSYSSISASPFKTYGMYGMGSFILLALIVQVVRKKPDVGA
ncbi:MAG: hypothetical protein HON53_25165, partial [Planctomycetaceae bacterium]|nr:hypothetical protein [Planctomycetaceae bacterium]